MEKETIDLSGKGGAFTRGELKSRINKCGKFRPMRLKKGDW
jgi:hypothetical protein